MRTILILAAMLFAIAAGPALASHDSGCVPGRSGSTVVVYTDPLDVGAPGFYVDFTLNQVGPLFSVWIYEESNGIPGLQRGDEVEVNEDCGHGYDTIIF